MTKLLPFVARRFLSLLLFLPLLGRAQTHLLITEFAVSPTAGEFIEIYNPGPAAVDLSNYYLSDEVFNNNNNYINVVKGGFTAFSSDFMVKFPAGTTIAPKQFLTIAFTGTGFATSYGKPADFEIKGDDPNTPDMTAVSVGATAGLSNDGEMIMLFYWDGQSDLVQDVDYVVWGDKAEAIDKTGISIDGLDADTTPSTYQPDTPVSQWMLKTTAMRFRMTTAKPRSAGSKSKTSRPGAAATAWAATMRPVKISPGKAAFGASMPRPHPARARWATASTLRTCNSDAPRRLP